MPRFGRGRSLVPVNSIKHIIDSEGDLTGARSDTPIATAVVTASTTFNPVEVEFGRKINGFFISVFMIGATGTGLDASLNWYIAKRHAGQAISDFPGADSTGTSQLRNQIIHQEKGLAGSADGTPMAFKGVIVVPRGMRRMREGDEWFISLKNNDGTNDATFCIRSIHKSFG